MKMRKLAKNTKALSPVIATIILVAVTVAIAIAVAAWLGALTFTYTNVEQLNVTGATITVAATGPVAFSLSNSGTTDVTIASLTVNGGTFNNAAGAMSGSPCSSGLALGVIPKGASCTLSATFTQSGASFVAGTSYTFKLASTQGHTFLYTTTA